MTTPILNNERAINATLYVANKLGNGDMHKIFKILYFADQSHLSKYARPITGDTYISMDFGPVPSFIYDKLKSIKSGFNKEDEYQKAFSVKNYNVIPKINFDELELSKTDLSELNAAIEKYGKLSMKELTDLSHKSAWRSAQKNKKISVEAIMEESGEDQNYIHFVVSEIECQKRMYGITV